jgi:holo-[acyl-carrier protein] synthase
MNIIGLGTHILDCPKVRRLIDTHADKFIRMVFTQREAEYCMRRSHVTEFYAAIWATKDALLRSLGIKWKPGVCWREVEVLCKRAITPQVKVTGKTAERMSELGVARFQVSFSYSRVFATATVIALG